MKTRSPGLTELHPLPGEKAAEIVVPVKRHVKHRMLCVSLLNMQGGIPFVLCTTVSVLMCLEKSFLSDTVLVTRQSYLFYLRSSYPT